VREGEREREKEREKERERERLSACVMSHMDEMMGDLVASAFSAAYERWGGGLGGRPIFKKFHETYASS